MTVQRIAELYREMTSHLKKTIEAADRLQEGVAEDEEGHRTRCHADPECKAAMEEFCEVYSRAI